MKVDVIEIGKEKWNADKLRKMTEDEAIRALCHPKLKDRKEASQVRNAWKQANKKK